MACRSVTDGAVSGQETLPLQLERTFAHRCRRRNPTSSNIRAPARGGFKPCARLRIRSRAWRECGKPRVSSLHPRALRLRRSSPARCNGESSFDGLLTRVLTGWTAIGSGGHGRARRPRRRARGRTEPGGLSDSGVMGSARPSFGNGDHRGGPARENWTRRDRGARNGRWNCSQIATEMLTVEND